TVEEKQQIMDLFKRLVYAHSENSYDEIRSAFLARVSEVEVRIRQKYVSLEKQFLENWDAIKEMWVHAYRKHLPLMGDTTTNRIERSFWTVKLHLQTLFRCTPSITDCLPSIIDFLTDRLDHT